MRKLWTRVLSLATCVAALTLAAPEAHAGSRVVLLKFSGRKADVLRERVAASLTRAGYDVVLSKSTSQGASAKLLKRLAKRSDADAVVTGRVRRKGMRLWTVALNVSDADGTAVPGSEIDFKSSWLPGLAKELSDTASKRLEAVLGRAEGPLEAPAEVEVWDADADSTSSASLASKTESSAGGSDEVPAADALFEVDSDSISDREPSVDRGAKEGGMVVRLRGRGGVVRHSLDFSDDIYNRLRTQRANIWVYQVDGALYPFERPIGERLGLIASFESVFSGNVRDTDFSANFPVIFQEMFAGVRARHPLGKHELGFDLTFGRMLSGLDDENGEANIPDMNYTLLRSVFDVTLDLGRVRATGSAGFRLPLGYGEVSHEDWFPRVGGYGFEASAGADYPLSKSVSLELTGAMRRYLLEMNSEPQDAMLGVSEVAGGAVDLYLAGYFGMSFKL
jgi:hypothetical protein